MEYSPQQLQEFRQEFQKRRKRQFMLAAPLIVLIAVALIIRQEAIDIGISESQFSRRIFESRATASERMAERDSSEYDIFVRGFTV